MYENMEAGQAWSSTALHLSVLRQCPSPNLDLVITARLAGQPLDPCLGPLGTEVLVHTITPSF